MSTKSGKKRTLSSISREFPSREDVEPLMLEINAGSDRAAALVAATWADISIQSLIISHLKNKDHTTLENLLGSGGALSTFSSKSHLAYALGLITNELYHNAGIVRKVRNAFAHTAKSISFANKEVAKECSKIQRTQILEKFGLDDDIYEWREWDPSRRSYCISAIEIGMYCVSQDIKQINRETQRSKRMIKRCKSVAERYNRETERLQEEIKMRKSLRDSQT